MGIGTSTPTLAKLQVNGNVYATSFTGSFSGSLVGTASYATTASYALNGGAGGSGPISVSGTTLYSNNPTTSGFNTTHSIFLGSGSGYGATYAYHSNFLGQNAGNLATDAVYSNFLGQSAGYQATYAYGSNFLGYTAGGGATFANSSNFIGSGAGYSASNAYSSNFLGASAGYSASNAYSSNFLGAYAGYQAVSASYSTLIGYSVGYNIPGGALGIKSNNIIIGTNITLPDGAKDSINLGGIIFATGSYSSIISPSSGSQYGIGKVGINIVTPTHTLDVSGSARITDILILPPRHPLPSGQPTGSFAVSGSNGNCKPYFYNGSNWNALF
jgi:hypothetical protein